MKKIAIIQSNYIPWRGYFDFINLVDEFILYDDAQYTVRDWRNRNRIKTADGAVWLTIPVQVKGKFHQKIMETRVSESNWSEKHWKAITLNYSRAPYFEQLSPIFFELYQQMRSEEYLSKINFFFIEMICNLLGITTKLSWSMDYELVEGKNEKLIYLCQQAGATDYLSGPAAKEYIDVTLFSKNGINVHWMNYDDYSDYQQLFSPPFESGVSIIDLLFNVGVEGAKKYMKTFQYRQGGV